MLVRFLIHMNWILSLFWISTHQCTELMNCYLGFLSVLWNFLSFLFSLIIRFNNKVVGSNLDYQTKKGGGKFERGRSQIHFDLIFGFGF